MEINEKTNETSENQREFVFGSSRKSPLRNKLSILFVSVLNPPPTRIAVAAVRSEEVRSKETLHRSLINRKWLISAKPETHFQNTVDTTPINHFLPVFIPEVVQICPSVRNEIELECLVLHLLVS